MYSLGSVEIVAGLLLCMLLSTEIGFRSGRRRKSLPREAVTQANAVLASMLGLLALLLAFTFSAALQRYDERSQAVVAESNAIGTAYLRARLLPTEMRDEVQGELRDYLELRLQEGHISSTHTAERASLQLQANRAAARLWDQAVKAAEQDAGPVTSGLFVQSLNELIDANGIRNASLSRHVPEVVLLLMFATIVMTTATLGYASGIAGHRVTLAAFVLVILIALVVFLIIDLDRPRRGIIQVSQESLLSLHDTIGAARETVTEAGTPAHAPQPPRR